MGRIQSKPSRTRLRQAREPWTGRVPLYHYKLHPGRSSHTDTTHVRGCACSTCRIEYSRNNVHHARLLGKGAINQRILLYQE